MPYETFQKLTDQLARYFQDRQYADALELITAEGPNFPNDRMLADYWKMVSAARLDNRELLYEVARKSLADRLWYGEVLWRQSPSYASLQGDPEFEQIVAESLKVQRMDMPASEPIVITNLPANHSSDSPLLIALHGNQTTAEKTRPFWEPAVLEGWVISIPQSDQVIFKNSFVWDDLEKSFERVRNHFEGLAKEIPFDAARVVLGGHSMGGLIAIEMALRGLIPVRGFVVNGPAVPFLEEPGELEKLLPLAHERGLRAYFIAGEQDDAINVPEIKDLAEKMITAGIPCEVEMIPNATHDYTSAHDTALLRGLAFVGG